MRFLLLIAGDIEANPGPECPCKERKNVFVINCSDCETAWHVDCAGLKEITEAPLRKLKSWKCAACINIPESVIQKIRQKLCPEWTNIAEEMKAMENRLNAKIEALKLSYSNKAQSGIVPSKGNITNRLVKTLKQKQDNKNTEEIKEKNERTLIIKKYMDPESRKKDMIRKAVRKEYPGVGIENARTTPGGSILVEFCDKETAENVRSKWNKKLFGGNQGAEIKKAIPPSGIIKNVFTEDLDDEEPSDDDIITEIKESYPDVVVDLFKKNEKFTGTLKIQFKTEDDLKGAMNSRIKIFDQYYKVERYIYKPRVIYCKYCQIFGHVYRVCENRLKGNKPKCGKCTEDSHETKDCDKNQNDYKCSHCQDSHETGSKNCKVMEAKLEEIIERSQNGE